MAKYQPTNEWPFNDIHSRGLWLRTLDLLSQTKNDDDDVDGDGADHKD